jgi:hypothetical protein
MLVVLIAIRANFEDDYVRALFVSTSQQRCQTQKKFTRYEDLFKRMSHVAPIASSTSTKSKKAFSEYIHSDRMSVVHIL